MSERPNTRAPYTRDWFAGVRESQTRRESKGTVGNFLKDIPLTYLLAGGVLAASAWKRRRR